MKICFLGDANSVHLKRWIDYFSSKGNEVYVITFSNDHDEDTKNVHYYVLNNVNTNINGHNWKYIFKIGQIKKYINNIKPDIINAHYVTSYGFLSSVANFHPLVVSAWGSDILVTPKKNTVYRTITKYALKKADLITSDSIVMSDEIKKLVNKDVTTIPMGVEKRLCYMDRKEDNDEIKILSLRTIIKNSNIDIIVKAFKMLMDEDKELNLKLVIANSGSELSNIKELIRDLKIEDKVQLIGMVSRKTILNLMQSSNINISIPKSDSTSVTLLEAMALGITNVVSNIPANREWINEENGFILEKFDEKELCEILKKAISNSSKEKFIKLNRDIIIKRAIWEDNMGVVEKKMRDLINK